MDEREDSSQDNVGSSTIQVVDSSASSNGNVAILLPEGMMMEDAMNPDRGDYVEPDQTDRGQYQVLNEYSNEGYVESSGDGAVGQSSQSVGSTLYQADNTSDNVGRSSDVVATSHVSGVQISQSDDANNCSSPVGSADDSQSPQAVPELEICASQQPSSSESNPIASSSRTMGENRPVELSRMTGAASSSSSAVRSQQLPVSSYVMDEEGSADGTGQESELQVVPDSGGSLLHRQTDTPSSSWLENAVTASSTGSVDSQSIGMYPTSSEAQMVPVSSDVGLQSCHVEGASNVECRAGPSYLSQQQVSNSEMDTVHVTNSDADKLLASSSQERNNELSSTEETVGSRSDAMSTVTSHDDNYASQSGMNLLSSVASSENMQNEASVEEVEHFLHPETNEVSGNQADSNDEELVCAGSVASFSQNEPSQSNVSEVMPTPRWDEMGEAEASVSEVLDASEPQHESDNVHLPDDASPGEAVSGVPEASNAGVNSGMVAVVYPDQSVPVDIQISGMSYATSSSQLDTTPELINEESRLYIDAPTSGDISHSQLVEGSDYGISEGNAVIDSSGYSDMQNNLTTNEASQLENQVQYICVSELDGSDPVSSLESVSNENVPDSASCSQDDLVTTGTLEQVKQDDAEDNADSFEHQYAVQVQPDEDDVEEEQVTYILQDCQDGSETFQIVTKEQLKALQLQNPELATQLVTAEGMSDDQVIEGDVCDANMEQQQYVLQAEVEGEEVLLHLPNIKVANDSNATSPHVITLGGNAGQQMEIIESLEPSPQTSNMGEIAMQIASGTSLSRTDVEQQTATVLSETLPSRIKTDFPPTSLARSLLTTNTTSVCTPIPSVREAPACSAPPTRLLPVVEVVDPVSNTVEVLQIGQTQQVVQAQPTVQTELVYRPQVRRPGQSLLRPRNANQTMQQPQAAEVTSFQQLVSSGQAEIVYTTDPTTLMQVEQGEELQMLSEVTLDAASNTTTILQNMATEAELENEPVLQQQQTQETEYSDQLMMAASNETLMPAADFQPRIEIQQSGPQVFDINGTLFEPASMLSPDNMQALLQILQALPFNTRGQTVQIVVQGDNNASGSAGQAAAQQIYQVAETPSQESKDQVVHLVQVMQNNSPTKTMSDMAVQVGPEDENGLPPNIRIRAAGTSRVRDVHSRGTGRRGSRRAAFRPLPETLPYSEPEDMGVESRVGVSYYAVMDYMSEQDGFSSSQELNRPEAPISAFMEDHLELQSDVAEGLKNRSLLESTLDETMVESPYRRKGRYKVLAISQPGTSIDLPAKPSQSSVTLQEKSYEQATIEGKNLAEQTYDDADPTSRPPRYTRGLRTIQQKRPNHRCHYCDYESRDKLLVMQHCESEHPEEPVRTITLMPKYTRRQCPYCKQEFNYAEFFQHMRYTHNEVHPYKCYYCDFQGRDRNQVKHHIRKKHAKPAKIINLLRDRDFTADGKRVVKAVSDDDVSVYEYMTDEDDDEWDENVERRGGLSCPECKKSFKTLKYLKTHIKMHRPHRYQCGYCDYIATFEHQILKHSIRKHGSIEPKIISKELEPEKYPLISRNIDDVMRKVFSLSMRQPKDPDLRKWARKWVCPHCDYTCQFGASFRRHIRMHANLLPYKCNYCSFKGREKYYVRRHIARMHHGFPEIVVENTAENRAGDTSSDEDFQEKGLRRRRRRRAKRVLKSVVPVGAESAENAVRIILKTDSADHNSLMDIEGDSRDLKRRAWEELESAPPVKYASYRKFDDNGNVQTYSHLERRPPVAKRPLRTSERTGETIGDFYASREGDNAICKVCGQKIHINVFYKHARKHFKIKPFKCSYCDYMAIERAKIRVHITFKHPLLPFKIEECQVGNLSPKDVVKVYSGTGDNQKWKPVEVNFTCPICQEQISGEEESLREHFYTHYDFKPYKCALCDTTFVSAGQARVHSLEEHGEETEAIVTDKLFPEDIEETIQQLLKEIEEATIIEAIPHTPVKRKRGRPSKAEKSPNLFCCPMCERQMNCHTATIRRHFYSHFEYKPFQCGYCNFKCTSDNEVKQHTVSHGSVPVVLVQSEDQMPPKLEEMLENFLEGISLTPKPKAVAAATSGNFGNSSDSSLVTDEGRRWKDCLVQGVCPWCKDTIGHFRPTAHRHLKRHFLCNPYKCGHCDFKARERHDIKRHISTQHPSSPISIIGPSVDIKEIEVGLRQYLWSKSRGTLRQNDKADNFLEPGKELDRDKAESSSAADKPPLKPLPSDFRKGKPSRLVPRKESYHSDTEILEVAETDAILLVRSFKSDAEISSNDSDSDGSGAEADKQQTTGHDEAPENFEVPQDVLQDIHYLLKMTCLPHDTPWFKRKGDWHRCNQCKRRFRKYSALKVHMMAEHAVEATTHHCCYCNYWNHKKATVKVHILSAHPGRRLLMREKLQSPKPGVNKRKREDDVANVARAYREPKHARIEEEEDEEEQEEEIEESVANIQQYLQSIDQPVVKRKRGRPRKIFPAPLDAANVEPTSGTIQLVTDENPIPPSQECPKEVVVHVTVTQASPPSGPKRRGRPPRKVPAEIVSPSSDTTAKSITETGESSKTSPTHAVASATPVRRGRGRPPRKNLPERTNNVVVESVPSTSKARNETTPPEMSLRIVKIASGTGVQEVVADSASQDDDDEDFEEVVLQLSGLSAAQNTLQVGKYKLHTKSNIEGDVMKLLGSPKRILRRKVVAEGEEELEEVTVEEDLENLENLEECDENLPKILKLLHLKPSQ